MVAAAEEEEGAGRVVPSVEERAGPDAPLRFEVGIEVAAVEGFRFVDRGKEEGEAAFEEKEVAFEGR